MKTLNEIRNCFLEEIEQNQSVSKKHKDACTTLNYIELFLIFSSAITGCVSVAAFASVLGIITNSAIGLNICATAAGI